VGEGAEWIFNPAVGAALQNPGFWHALEQAWGFAKGFLCPAE
jgi:hypothetical protein